MEKIKRIEAEKLCWMEGKEGLVLQGCGGNLSEWVEGINGLLKEEGILPENTGFLEESCLAFVHDGLTCLLFPFSEKMKLDMGKLAIWRIKTHEKFNGTWFSDYVENRLGGFADGQIVSEENGQRSEKPDCPLIGQDENIFHLMGIASQTLKQNGMAERAKEMCTKVCAGNSYEEALSILDEYVTITSVDGRKEENGMDMQL